MITYVKMDITKISKGIIAHGVNCQHRMGAGVALAIKNKWPTVYKAYMASGRGKDMLGHTDIIIVEPHSPIYVANCYTQEFYGPGDKRYASPAAIKNTLRTVYDTAEYSILDVYLPKIGAGLGGLDWETDVEPIIIKFDTLHTVNTYICTID